jgi:hypothetical protein
MNCPYCLSDVNEGAVVCRTCSRDLYLFKPMMTKVADLERRLDEIPNSEAYEKRIAELEAILDEQEQKQLKPRASGEALYDIVIYLLVPLTILLLAHVLITIVYDTNMIYLRLISMAIPLPFGYFLFKGYQHKIFPWFMGVIFLATTSVIGMSWITSLVDGSSVWPRTIFEWREVLEYAASISFSFLTGMLLGGVAFANRQRHRRSVSINPMLRAVATGLGEGKLSPSNLYLLMKNLQEYGATIIALGTTVLSIYAGLKGIIGS